MKPLMALSLLMFIGPSLRAAATDPAIVYPSKTISDCANDLVRDMIELDQKTAEKYCKEYSQQTIDCAHDLASAKNLTYNFEKAIKNCSRVHDK